MGTRLDNFLVEKAMAVSRTKAKEIIKAGLVLVNGRPAIKAGELVSKNDKIQLTGEIYPYVSRGGLKLEKALKDFSVDLMDKVCGDIGASTGGFTDCMLQNGACKVYSIDVGTGQLDKSLRQNPKVVVMENTNIRHFKARELPEPLDFIAIDVSFISLTLVLAPVAELLSQAGQLVCLIKPQFEAGRAGVGKGGVVKSKQLHIKVIDNVINSAAKLDLGLCGLTFSPIKGPRGNIEYLAFFKNNSRGEILPQGQIESIVADAENVL